jgi:hypothetical protein
MDRIKGVGGSLRYKSQSFVHKDTFKRCQVLNNVCTGKEIDKLLHGNPVCYAIFGGSSIAFRKTCVKVFTR